MSRLLVLYASHHGQTRAIAHRIAAGLREHGDQVELADASASPTLPAPAGYDAVVIGSRIELGHHASSIVGYLRSHRDVLEHMPTCLFSVSMAAAGGGTDPNGYVAALVETIGWRPTCSVTFGGALKYRKYNWFTRFMMKRVSRAAGHTTDTSKDHDFTDWDAVRAFADDVHARLPGGGVAARIR